MLGQESPQTTKGLLLTLGGVLSAGGFAFLADSVANFPIDFGKLIAGLCLIAGAFICFFIREKFKKSIGE